MLYCLPLLVRGGGLLPAACLDSFLIGQMLGAPTSDALLDALHGADLLDAQHQANDGGVLPNRGSTPGLSALLPSTSSVERF